MLSADLSKAQTAGMSSFGNFLGLGRNCQTGNGPSKIKRVAKTRRAVGKRQAPSGILPYSNSTGAPILNTGEKAAIGVVVSFSVVAITAAAVFIWRLAKRRRRKDLLINSGNDEKKPDEPQPFLQIEGEVNSRYEMPAEVKKHELHTEDLV